MMNGKNFIKRLELVFLLLFSIYGAVSQPFNHPGIHQTRDDLDYMKSQVQKGEQPWKDAFTRMIEKTDKKFEVNVYTHVMRGPYGKPNIGGDDLSKGAAMAYRCALAWYITEDREYAEKAIEIINSWSDRLWDFDYNDAKLLAAWTGHELCNAAEIIRYTPAGWSETDQEKFRHMLMSVYYPLIRYYFPRANGNWDGAIIHSILAIAVYTDNREMFNNGINHFLYGPVNGSIFKYIWPSGQCQETMRDQGHVQLGLGEFAGAAQIAWTQGVDLFSIAGNRLALGYEYTAGFLLGKIPHAYGKISERALDIRDDYEYVYRHYTSQGVEVPFTRMAADSVRLKADVSVLTAFRAPDESQITIKVNPVASSVAWPAGALDKAVTPVPETALYVNPGEPVQVALDNAAANKGWVVLRSGIHILPDKLLIPGNVTISGEGLSTVLFLDPEAGRDALVNKSGNLEHITLCDLVIEGAANPDPGSDPNSRRSFRSSANRGGILFLGNYTGDLKNITLRNITVRNSTFNGVFISGAENVTIHSCDFSENGSDVVPGPKLQHNLLLSHCKNVEITGSRLVTSPYGCGVAVTGCAGVKIQQCEIARNAHYGVLITESKDILLRGNLVEGNDKSGIMAEFLSKGSADIWITENLIHFNNGWGIESYAATNLKSVNNTLTDNSQQDQQKLSTEKYIVIQ